MHHTVAIIQARLRSTRLPGKTMLMLPTGRTVIEEVVVRCQQISGVNQVVVAIPDSNDILFRHLQYNFGVQVIFGPEHDVLKRYAIAAMQTRATRIMRITSDCPLTNPTVCTEVLKMMDEGYDYVSNCHPRTFPKGYDCEVFTRAALDWANGDEHLDAESREHVTPAIYTNHPDPRKIGNYAQEQDQSHIRLTLDDIDDYIRICEEFQRRSGVNE